MMISLIVAVDRVGGIGKDGGIPWRLRTDLRHFKALTMGHYLIVGRRTWESIGRRLPGRKVIVVSRQLRQAVEGVTVVSTLEAALRMAQEAGEVEAFIGGGAQIFVLALPLAGRIYLTEVAADCACDVFMPPIDPAEWQEVERTAYPAGEQDEYAFIDRVLERQP